MRSGARGQFEEGLSLFNRGLHDEAVSRFQKAVELDPEFGQAHLYLGRSYLSLSRFGQAVTALRTAYRLAPDNVRGQMTDLFLDALVGAALTGKGSGNLTESLEYLKEALQLDPRSEKAKKELAAVLALLGADLLREGKIPEAVRTYLEALGYAPGDISLYLGLARAFLNAGDVRRALEAAEKALAHDPQNREAMRIIRELLGK